MNLTKKPPSPLKRALRNLQLGFSFGIGAFLLGTLLSSRLSMALYGPLAGVESQVLGFLVFGLVFQLPVLLAAPLIAYVVGLFVEGPRWMISWSMVAGVQMFPLAIEVVTNSSELLVEPVRIVFVLLATVAGGFLCAWAFARGQKKARERAVAPAAVPQAGTLAQIDFEAVKKAADGAGAAAVPSAETAADAVAAQSAETAAAPAEAPAAPVEKTGS